MDPLRQHQVTWLNSCLQETLLPSSPWHKVGKIFCEKLVGVLEPKLERPEIRQSLYELLGDVFVRRYFQSWPDKPMVLEHPFMLAHAKREAQVIAEQLLSNASDIVLEDLITGSTCLELQEFQQFCKCLVKSRVNEQIKGTSGDSRFFQSKTIGSALACLLHRRPEQLKTVCKTLYGKLLPDSLRGCIWSLTLEGVAAKLSEIARKGLGHETLSSGDERMKRFIKAIGREMDIAAYKSPLKSSISGLIQRSVEQAYQTSLPLSNQLYKTLQWKSVIQNVLNCLYIYNKSYEPTHIYLSFPVMLAFVDRRLIENDENHCLELAWRLHDVVTYCFPTQKAISDMSDDVIRTIQRTDELLYLHLISTIRRVSLGQHQEFLTKLAASDDSGQASVLGPEMFIRKWITEGFVSVLEYHSMLFLWDQLFLADWEPFAIQKFCLAILRLLREQLLAVETFEQLHKVLLWEPCRLFLKDIQAEWMNEGRSY